MLLLCKNHSSPLTVMKTEKHKLKLYYSPSQTAGQLISGLIALHGRSKNRTGHLETTHTGWTNKMRLTVCSEAIVKREYLVLVFFSCLDS